MSLKNSEDFKRHLCDTVCLIIEYWGEGEAVDGERITEIASKLYGYSRELVLEAIIKNLSTGRIRGKFYKT